jgi:hypothetical protein
MDKRSWIEKNAAGVMAEALHPFIGLERQWRGERQSDGWQW